MHITGSHQSVTEPGSYTQKAASPLTMWVAIDPHTCRTLGLGLGLAAA